MRKLDITLIVTYLFNVVLLPTIYLRQVARPYVRMWGKYFLLIIYIIAI